MSKIEQELKRKIAQKLFELFASKATSFIPLAYKEDAEVLWNNIKPSLPELAKQAGYVQLDKDQTLPRNKMSMASKLLWAIAEEAREDMLKANFKKVEDDK